MFKIGMSMNVYANTLELIGRTPMVQLTRLNTGCCQLFLKLEDRNLGGSIKDRIALQMIESAEKNGLLKPGMTIVEATAGNTGIGLAVVAALKDYHLILVLPDKMSQEKIAHLRALGAEVILTRSDVNKGHPEYYQDMAAAIATERPNCYYINQFANPANPLAHELTTGPEIWEQMDHKIDALVYGVGSSGGITGMGHFLKSVAPNIEIIAADPVGSIITEAVNTGSYHESQAKWFVEGIGEDFIPEICDLSVIDSAISVSDQDSFATARDVLRKEGLLVGSSAGTMIHAALLYCQRQTTPKRVVTILCDTGNKYLSKMFNDAWLAEKGFTI
jgi:cystathionine beta-synthase